MRHFIRGFPQKLTSDKINFFRKDHISDDVCVLNRFRNKFLDVESYIVQRMYLLTLDR